MLDRTHAGFRCHTLQLLRTVKGDLPRGSHGTVAYEMDNLGRHLIFVNWDQGFSVPVFPNEVELQSAPHRSNSAPSTSTAPLVTSPVHERETRRHGIEPRTLDASW